MNYYFFLAIALLTYMSFLFLISLIKKRNDVADIGWGLGFVLLAWISFYFSYQAVGFSFRSIIVSAMITLWGFRLAGHIYLRNKGKEEDYRYKKWREEWGKWFYLRSYGQVYILQGILLFTISLPVLFINKNTGVALEFLDVIAILIWLVGFFFEVVSDYQLKKFIDDPNKSGIMEEGLWKYSRHPNYFGEVAGWWGIWLLAASAGGWWTIISPITITLLILKISGIPLLEEKLSKRDGFEEYKQRVSKFIPLPPKSK
ncbi:MAG: DUF1295 domain-containing protein [Patescibacteria group bacterium]